MRRAASTALTVVLLAAALAGCGRDRLPVPDVSRPQAATAIKPVTAPADGLRFALPAGWDFVAAPGGSPLVGTASSGSATIAIWRYPRTEPLPDSPEDLRDARRRLVEAARIRDRSFSAVRERTLRVDGAPAVQVVGDGTTAGRPRRIRSTHVYAKGAEYVVDAYAAPGDFSLADRVAFRRLVRSLRIDPPRS